MKNQGKLYKIWLLFLTFFKIGAFTFGGGYAMIPLIQREVADKRKWITEDDILDIIAIAESTPGPIAVNSATFVGFKTAGFFGAFASTLGVVLPSFVIITVIAYLLRNFSDYKGVRYAFFGVRAGVLALIIKGLVSMYKQVNKNLVSYVIMGAAFVLVAFFNVNVLLVIIGCAVFGLVTSIVISRRAKNDLS
ncbi:MAG: chromate transporter [Oscillospiraceae bacterium]|nr:chromate transporter [Oscillospiraceae bacterium]